MENDGRTFEPKMDKSSQLELEVTRLKEEIAQMVNNQIAYKNLIAERKLLEEKYKRSQLRFQTIFEESQLGNKILTPDLEIVEVNPAFVLMLGYANKNDLINRKILEFAHPDFIKHWHQLQIKLWEEKIPTFSLDTCMVKKDKSTIWCHVTSILFEDDQRTLGYTVIENINERKHLEEKTKRLYHNQELIMNMVAHDLKSPINSIQGLSNLIRKDLAKNELQNILLALSMIDQTCIKSEEIIGDLLLIGELENDSIEKQKEDIGEIFRAVIEQVSAIALDKEIKIIQDFQQTQVIAKVNRVKLIRAIENLLSNAIKFSNSGGQVKTILRQEESSFLLQIKDEGIGIPLNMQNSVFNKFTKAKRKGTEGEDTTGLGLFITNQIVEIHNGKIWFESQQNVGTTFYMQIPLS